MYNKMRMKFISYFISILLLSSLFKLNSAQNAIGNLIGIGAETAADLLQQTYGYFQQGFINIRYKSMYRN